MLLAGDTTAQPSSPVRGQPACIQLLLSGRPVVMSYMNGDSADAFVKAAAVAVSTLEQKARA